MKKQFCLLCIFAVLLTTLLAVTPVYAVEEKVRPLGDVNGNFEVDVGDARMILQHLVRKITLDETQLIYAKVSDGNGDLSVADARLILQFLVKKIAEFPGKLPDEPDEPPDFPYPEPDFPYQDVRLTFAERAADLISRMTPQEKQAQLYMRTPAIARLGVSSYDYWNEALHGITEKDPSTSFPVPLSIAASWNTALMEDVASAISNEARGYASLLTGTKTLSYWSPTINLSRDPRWGRNEECYSEDPYLTSVMAGKFVDGMQGNNDKVRNPYTKEPYLKAVSTLKHYAANNSEFNRFYGDSVMDDMSLRNYYTWAYMDITLRSPAASVMTAFNSVNGIPATVNGYLLDTLLRKTWGFEGYVVSDCDAVRFLVDQHRWVPPGGTRAVNRREAVAFAMKAGTDLDCRGIYQEEALNAVNATNMQTGITLTMDDIDRALLRIFTVRMRTGEFDPPELVAYRAITAAAKEAPAHRELALQAARESLVLLKNDNNMLPLNLNGINSIAVYGPMAKVCSLGAENYTAQPSQRVSFKSGLETYLAQNNYTGSLTFYDGVDPSGGADQFVVNLASVTFKADGLADQTRNAVTAVKGPGDMFDEPDGVSNVGRIRPRSYLTFKDVDVTDLREITVRTANPNQTDTLVEMRLDGPDGMLLAEVICPPTGNWQTYRYDTTDKLFVFGDYSGLRDVCLIFYHSLQGGLKEDEIAKAAQADLAIVFAGTSGDRNNPNFRVAYEDQDRLNLKLPAAQDYMAAEVAKRNPNIVVVLQTAGMVDLARFKDDTKAILYSSYNGQYQGNALTETLFGLNNPSGKLTATWYKDEAQLPNIADYTIKAENGLRGRTYQYFTGAVEYPFGYGLSYTNFVYSDITLNKTSIAADGSFNVSLKVTNTGSRAGADVVQVYIGAPDYGTNPDVPQKELRGFARVSLNAGETKTVTVPMKVSDFSRVHENDGPRTVTPGTYKIMVGRSVADIKDTKDITVTAAEKATIQAITLRGDKVVALPGDVFKTELTVAMSDESFLDATGAVVTYTSSNENVVTVDAAGIVTALDAGVATITATVTVNGATKTGSFPVAVKAA
ncbi:MAG: glycoside hydrolase family 3 C-terminal domain-containing protein [Oscillospiraceae bacterium]|nr:glycoside hydrolase family 3 C-terminal domain-containing protein [Oscillospiraceae bacterium]